MINRNKNFFYQVKLSFIYKVIAIIISFFLVRFTLEYLGTTNYGIWAVLLNVINWILFFDFGIANGIKNKISESLSKNDYQNANTYISTGYFILFIFCFIIFIVFIIFSFSFDWQSLFNVYSLSNEDLRNIMIIVVSFILLNFSLSIIIAILNAVQKTSLIVYGQLLTQILSLVFIIILLLFTENNLYYIAFSYGFSLVFSSLVITFLFYKDNKHFLPSFRFCDKNKIKSILNLGIKFFFLQITLLFILTTDTMLISHLLGSEYVSTYDILYKFFGLLMVIHSLLNTPLWSMYTDAYYKNDYLWIKNILIKMALLMIIYFVIIMFLYFYSEYIIHIWLGNNNLILKKSNIFLMGILIFVLIWYSIFAYFTNGINKTTNQLYSASFGAIIHIPLAIYFVNYLNMNLDGVILSTIISLSIFGITGPIQAIIEINKMKNKQIINLGEQNNE